VSETSRQGNPRVSIIVPAYNAADFLAATIDDLLRQTLTDTEIVVVDDGSADATAEVALRAARADPRVHFVRLAENGGVSLARERAVHESRGEFLWFVDADDERAPDALAKLVAAAEATAADVVICSAEYVYEAGRTRPIPAPRLAAPVSGAAAFTLLLDGGITGHLWNKLFRREHALRIGYPPARVHSDLAMVAQLLAGADQVAAIPDTLYFYRLRSGSIIRSGTRRAESLLLVEQTVQRAAAALDPALPGSADYRYFVLRYIVLSGMKDALTGPYDAQQSAALVRRLRARLTWGAILLTAQRRDGKRLALALSAKLSLRAHRALLGAASERLVTPGRGARVGVQP
jgi:glycosyltransferase involved in cell wall biosynthesis